MELLRRILSEPGVAVIIGMVAVFLLLAWATRTPKREPPRPWKGRPTLVDRDRERETVTADDEAPRKE